MLPLLACQPTQASEDVAVAARVLAGLPLESADGKAVPTIVRSPAYANHQSFMSEHWGRIERRHLRPIEAFGSAAGLSATTLVYPFAGPDLAFARAFFPRAETLVLIGLEPIGGLPDPGDARQWEVLLSRVRRAFVPFARAGYFVTEDMGRPHAFPGVLPLLLIAIARSGGKVDRIAGVEGTAVPPAARLVTSANAAVSSPTAIAIDFHNGDGARRRVYYIAADLSDMHFEDLKLTAVLGRAEHFATLLKSASYLLHTPDFAMLKAWLLARSDLIVQDDTGVPLADLDPRTWKVRLFGRYLPPVGRFAQFVQPSMLVDGNPRVFEPLDFAIGYGATLGGSHLAIARRLPLPERP